MSSRFRCGVCGGVFLKGRSDEDALAEMRERFGDMPESERVIVCSGCAKEVNAWMEKEIQASALREFADRLDSHRPSAVQLEISPDYNDAVIKALVWAAQEARTMADELLHERPK